jgi:hypothetical protein
MDLSFEGIISSSLGPTPSPKYIYSFPNNGGNIYINEEDKESYLNLFYKSPNKGVGNGEIALYWLFSTGENKPLENRKSDNADLIINGNNCEIKSYDSHNEKITLGKFKNDKETRFVINMLFSFYNLYTNSTHFNFKSEIKFNYDDILDCYKLLLENKKDIITLDQHVNLIQSYQTLIYNNLTPEDYTYNILKQLIINKFQKKPGDKGYVINCLIKNPMDVYAHKVDFENITKKYDVFSKNVKIESGEIKVSYRIFE